MKTSRILVGLSALAAAILIPLSIASCTALGQNPGPADQERFRTSDNYDAEAGLFINRDRDAYERMRNREKPDIKVFNFLFSNANNERPIPGLPVMKPEVRTFLEPSDNIKLIWFGHSTVLVNLNGKLILIDPMLSDYASPVFFTIRRFQEPPLTLEELPSIDYVLISHDHYDHLDKKTIEFLSQRAGKFLVPLGVGSHLKSWGVDAGKISELDWWQSAGFNDLEFVATPAQHFSGRSFADTNQTLWASWVVTSGDQRIFFSGDSGYAGHFREIGERYGPFDITFIENGQYNTLWEEVHLLPHQGLRAFQELQGRAYFPIHWGAFKLSTHPWYEPIQRITELTGDIGFPLIAPKIGEIVSVDEHYTTSNWWDELIPETAPSGAGPQSGLPID